MSMSNCEILDFSFKSNCSENIDNYRLPETRLAHSPHSLMRQVCLGHTRHCSRHGGCGRWRGGHFEKGQHKEVYILSSMVMANQLESGFWRNKGQASVHTVVPGASGKVPSEQTAEGLS